MEESYDNLATKHAEKHHPSFFQIYLEQHNSKSLGIPPPYMKNFKGQIPKHISLKNVAGRVWPAKLKYINKKLHITEGWDRYAREHSLKNGEFLVLTYMPKSTFQIMCYGSDAFVKEEPQEKTTNIVRRKDTGLGKKFHMTFRGRNFVCVPKRILDECAYKLPQSIKLSNEKRVGVLTELRDQRDRVVVGYSKLACFWRTNGVQYGDEIEFEIICGKSNNVKEMIMKNITQSKDYRRGY